jgi:hypothetical protein
MSTRKIKRRDIAQIADDLAAALKRESANIIEIGGLLIEAKGAVGHGKWLPWLETNFGESESTANNYMSAARLAAKSPTVGDLRLRPTTLYLLGSKLDDGPDDLFSPKAIEAILKEAETDWVNPARAYDIAASLRPPPEIDDDDDEDDRASEAEQRALEEEQRRKIEDILDSPPPELPPPPPLVVINAALQQFDKAVAMLAQVYTKSLADFASTEHSPDRIRSLGDFLVAVADAIAKRRAA